MEKAVFGGGCFWCTEAIFKMLKGVNKVLPGYAHSTSSGQAGEEVIPTYELVSTGTTDFAEVVYIEYEPKEIAYRDLLTVFFGSHDSTTVNRQGNDIGPQYRSVIFFTTPEQEAEAGKYIKEIPGAVTELVPLDKFYEAENYHRDYYENNKNAPYCQVIINPKLDKVQKEFAKLLKKTYQGDTLGNPLDKWENKLTPEEYAVMREKETEAPFTGEYLHTKEKGTYTCKGCGAELFKSDAKFDSGTGWPSFDEPANLENIELKEDDSHGMKRTEVLCKQCGAHLGHLFDDGPTGTGKRYCINSVCLNLEEK